MGRKYDESIGERTFLPFVVGTLFICERTQGVLVSTHSGSRAGMDVDDTDISASRRHRTSGSGHEQKQGEYDDAFHGGLGGSSGRDEELALTAGVTGESTPMGSGSISAGGGAKEAGGALGSGAIGGGALGGGALGSGALGGGAFAGGALGCGGGKKGGALPAPQPGQVVRACELNPSCSICLFEYLLDEEVTLLPCGHLYHTEVGSRDGMRAANIDLFVRFRHCQP